MRTIENAGVSSAGLQEVHGPQAQALQSQYAAKWGMYPASGKAQNRVIWDRNEWEQTDGRLVDIPYFGGKEVGMPLVQLISRSEEHKSELQSLMSKPYAVFCLKNITVQSNTNT